MAANAYSCLSSTVIPSLSLGLSLSSRHLDSEHLDSFMRRMLVSRLSRRVLAEHHVALSDSLAGRIRQEDVDTEGGRVGIIWTALNVRSCVEKCVRWLRERAIDLELDGAACPARHPSGEWPEVMIDGHLRTRFSYIREHLEFVLPLSLRFHFTALTFTRPQIYCFRATQKRKFMLAPPTCHFRLR